MKTKDLKISIIWTINSTIHSGMIKCAILKQRSRFSIHFFRLKVVIAKHGNAEYTVQKKRQVNADVSTKLYLLYTVVKDHK